MIIENGNLNLKQYEETEPPYRLPDNMDIFTWSLPFVAEKVTNMLHHMVKKGDDYIDIDEDQMHTLLRQQSLEEKLKKKLSIKSKVNSVARISRMFTTLREESEMLLKIKNISPDGKIPRGLLMAGKPAIKNGKVMEILDNVIQFLSNFNWQESWIKVMRRDQSKVNEILRIKGIKQINFHTLIKREL